MERHQTIADTIVQLCRVAASALMVLLYALGSDAAKIVFKTRNRLCLSKKYGTR